MIFIGERINTGFKDIKQAVLDKDTKPIQEWAMKQTQAGANYLDVNLGAVSRKPEDMCWMIEAVQAVVDTPISIDSNKANIIGEAIKACKKTPLINSTMATEESLNQIMPIAAEHHTCIIGVVMDETGTPTDVNRRVENAGKIMAKAMELGIPSENLFLDPIIMPMKFMQDQLKAILESIRQFTLFSDPPPHISCGLSNVSNGALQKKLINRVFLSMAIGCGLDTAICDVMDTELVNSALTAELVMNKHIYADSYVRT